jgi:beta-lactamase class A
MLLAWCVAVAVAFVAPARVSAQAAAAVTPAAPAEEKRRVLWRKLEMQVQETARQLDGVPGIAVEDLTTGEKILVNPDALFPQASTIKIAVLAELYHQDQQAAGGASGKSRLTDPYVVRAEDVVQDSDILAGLTPGVTRLTNRDLATMTVAVSDNGATNVLIDRLGMEDINAFLDGLGLRATRLRRRMMDLKAAREGRENVSTPREMMTLFEAIRAGKVFDEARTADFWKMLSTPKSSALRRGLPDGVVAANKTGSLEGVRNDCGLVFAPERPYVLCVMTTYLADEKAGEDAIARISAAAWSYFDRVGRSSPLGRVISTR